MFDKSVKIKYFGRLREQLQNNINLQLPAESDGGPPNVP